MQNAQAVVSSNWCCRRSAAHAFSASWTFGDIDEDDSIVCSSTDTAHTPSDMLIAVWKDAPRDIASAFSRWR